MNLICIPSVIYIVLLSTIFHHPLSPSFTHLNLLGRLLELVVAVAVLLKVDAESDGSKLPARGVINPPPSILMGIINSRGLFFIGWLPLPLTLIVLCVAFVEVAVSVSESFVDCRDRDERNVLAVEERCCC